ncbi:DUF4282 domain-containing protein [Peptostreptococcaceae bacterium AGR-M142]
MSDIKDDVKNDFKNVHQEIKKDGFFKTFLNFDKMITPVIIKIIFYIGLVVSILSSLGMIFRGMTSHYYGGSSVIIGILMLIFSPILVRVYCELLIIAFKIHESLVEIKNKN